MMIGHEWNENILPVVFISSRWLLSGADGCYRGRLGVGRCDLDPVVVKVGAIWRNFGAADTAAELMYSVH
jgi:hypothetical protein